MKLLYVVAGILIVVIVFIGYHFIKYLRATSWMYELSAQLELKIQDWEKKEYKRPPLFSQSIPGDARAIYQEALDKVEKLKPDEETGIKEYIYDPTKLLSPAARAYYERNKFVIEAIKKGVNAETYKPLLNISDFLHSVPPYMGKARTVAKIMVIMGRELESENRFPEALELYCSIIRFGNDYFREGAVVSALVGMSISIVGQKEIQRLLIDTKPSEQDLTRLISAFKILLDSNLSLQEVYNTEKLGWEFLIKLNSTEGKEILPKHLSFYRIQAWDDVIFFYGEAEKLSLLPYYQSKDELITLNTKIEALTNPLSSLFLPGILKILKTNYKLQANLRGIYILAALKLHKLKHGNYSVSLEELAPAIIPQVPLDPFSDKPFIYKLNADGTIMLYSVGDDLKDDGGDEKEDVVISPMEKAR